MSDEKERKVCACAASQMPAKEIRPQHGIKKEWERRGEVKKHRMNLSLQYTEEMKQSILCSWAEPVDDDEPLQNFPAGHSTAALFIPVPKPSPLQPIILWQPAYSPLSYTRLGRKENTGDDLTVLWFKGTVQIEMKICHWLLSLKEKKGSWKVKCCFHRLMFNFSHKLNAQSFIKHLGCDRAHLVLVHSPKEIIWYDNDVNCESAEPAWTMLR